MTALAWPLDVAVSAAILADVPLAALLGGEKVYSGTAPVNADFDYIVLGTTGEDGYDVFHTSGSQATLQLDLWCAGNDKRAVQQMWTELRRVLHYVRLTVTGFGICYGPASLITVAGDGTGEYTHGVVHYSPMAL
jgi:hypothetical protein